MAWSAPTEWERWDPDKLIQCPYDEVHRIPAKRYQYHIIKCREQHPEKDFVSCPFNAKHVMLRTELRRHITRCADKSEVGPKYKASEMDSEEFYFKGDTSVPCYRREELSIPPDDVWDRDDDDDDITTKQNLCEYYKTKHLTSNKSFSQPVVNSHGLKDVLSLERDNRENLKNNMRHNALLKLNATSTINGAKHRNVHHDNECPNNYLSLPSQIKSNHLGYSLSVQTDNDMSFCSHSNDTVLMPHTSNLNGVSFRSSSMQANSQHTFRGAGRARLAEEARRTQFGFVGRGQIFNAPNYQR